MDWGTVVVDISSDDESDGFSIDKQLEFDVNCFFVENEGVDVDDIVLLDDYFDSSSSSSGIYRSSRRGKRSVASRDDSDDDCLVLDGDPDKLVSDDGKGCVGGGGGDASDDLLIVGQKGQVACRDFPHSRHLCATFPFCSTSHEKHCNLCHCFVCDSPAPCIYWGSGLSLADHCHATDKIETWKMQRRSFKKMQTPTFHCQGLAVRTENTIRFPPAVLGPNPSNHLPITQVVQHSKGNPLRPCTKMRSFTCTQLQNRQGQNLNGLQPHSRIPYPQRENCGSDLTKSLSVMQSHAQFKRVGMTSTRVGITTASSLQQSSMSMPQYTASSPRPMPESAPRASLHQSVSSVGCLQQPAALRRSLRRSQLNTQLSQNTASATCEDGIRNWQEMLANVASELGVSDCTTKSATASQLCTAPSQPRGIDVQNSILMNGSQGTGLVHADLFEMTMPSDSSNFDSRWPDPGVKVHVHEHFQGGISELAAERISNTSVYPSDVSLESILVSIERETISETMKEPLQLEVDPAASLYDIEGEWSF